MSLTFVRMGSAPNDTVEKVPAGVLFRMHGYAGVYLRLCQIHAGDPMAIAMYDGCAVAVTGKEPVERLGQVELRNEEPVAENTRLPRHFEDIDRDLCGPDSPGEHS